MDARHPTCRADCRQQMIDAPNRDAGRQEAKRHMLSSTIEHRNEGFFHGVSVPTMRQRSLRVRRGCGPSQPGPRRWALVQVWDGAVLASFDHETGAREAMTGLDDDEVVVLCVGT
jgi:hypothetical protein